MLHVAFLSNLMIHRRCNNYLRLYRE